MCGLNPCASPDCTWGEKHLKACECNTVSKWSKEERMAYYQEAKKKRGEAAARELVECVNAVRKQ